MESDEIDVKENNKKDKSIKIEKLSSSVELFVKNFENAGLEKHPFQLPSKKLFDNKIEIKYREYEAKNLEGKTAAEVFQHFKTKFNISEMFAKNLQQIKELKKNFQGIKNAVENVTVQNPTSNEETKKVETKSKEFKGEDSFEEITEKDSKKIYPIEYQSSRANVT